MEFHSTTPTYQQVWPLPLPSGVARNFPGVRVAHPEGQKEEENEQSLRKNKKIWSWFEEKLGKWNSCPPGTVRLATDLPLSIRHPKTELV